MKALGWPVAALGWLGRQGPRAVAASVFIGLVLPQLAALFRPFVTEQIFLLLCIAFLRVEPADLRGILARPALALAAIAWTMLVIPLVYLVGFRLLAPASGADGLMLALTLQAVAPPVLSSPAFAMLLGLDATLSLSVTVIASAATPLAAPVLTGLLLGGSMEFSVPALTLKLIMLIVGPALTALVLRRLLGLPWLRRHSDPIDGLNVIILFGFAAGLMEGVGARILSDPLFVLGLAALTFALSYGLMALTLLAFVPFGRGRGLVVALASSQRNMGLMVAALGGAVPDVTWLYFALAQFPIYLAPLLLRRLVRRLAPPPQTPP